MRALGLALMLLLTAGCFGVRDNPNARDSVAPAKPTRVDWRITYQVGSPESDRLAVPGCPRETTCRLIRDPRFSEGSSAQPGHPWEKVAVWHVFCAPSGRQTSAPCQAIGRLRAILASPAYTPCFCPAILGIPGSAVARISGRRIVVPLDGCAYCGHSLMSKQTPADLDLLQPPPPPSSPPD
jgi:hypothetical protein